MTNAASTYFPPSRLLSFDIILSQAAVYSIFLISFARTSFSIYFEGGLFAGRALVVTVVCYLLSSSKSNTVGSYKSESLRDLASYIAYLVAFWAIMRYTLSFCDAGSCCDVEEVGLVNIAALTKGLGVGFITKIIINFCFDA